MFCALCRRLFWRDPKPGGRLSSRSKHAQSAGRRTRPEAVSERMKSNGIRGQDRQSLKYREIAFAVHLQGIRRCRLLLHGSGLLAQQHGCSESDELEDFFRQDLCYWLGNVDLFLWWNHDLEVFAVGFIVGHE